MSNESIEDYDFRHLIEFQNQECVYCSAREKSTGRARLFLIFNERHRIYVHNGTEKKWDELTDENSYNNVRTCFNRAVSNNRIPYLTSLSDSIENFDHNLI